MRGEPPREPALRLATLLALAGLPALLAGLLLAAWAWSDRRVELLAELEARAREQHRAVEAIFVGPADAEAAAEAGPRDVAGRREQARAMVAALEWPAGSVRLVERAAGSAEPAAVPGLETGVSLRPIAGSGMLLEHRVAASTLRRAALRAALPWLMLAPALVLTLAGAYALLRRGLLLPATAALDALVEVAAGRPAGHRGGWTTPWLESGLAAARQQAARLAAAEAVEAPLLAALEAVEQGVALLAPDGRMVLANAAFARELDRLGLERPAVGAPLARATRGGLERSCGLRELRLASGGRLLLLPGGSPVPAAPAPAAPAPAAPPAVAAKIAAGPRLAGMVQEVAEALALVVRQAVLLHELAAEPATRRRAEQLRLAAERCTRAMAPLLAPPPRARPAAVAVDRLLEGRLERLRRQGVEIAAGLAPALPPVAAEADRLADLIDGLLAAALQPPPREGPARLCVRLRRAGPSLILEVERLALDEGERGRPAGLALLQHRARELGAGLAAASDGEAGRVLRLELPLERPPPVESVAGRLVVLAGERGAA